MVVAVARDEGGEGCAGELTDGVAVLLVDFGNLGEIFSGEASGFGFLDGFAEGGDLNVFQDVAGGQVGDEVAEDFVLSDFVNGAV